MSHMNDQNLAPHYSVRGAVSGAESLRHGGLTLKGKGVAQNRAMRHPLLARGRRTAFTLSGSQPGPMAPEKQKRKKEKMSSQLFAVSIEEKIAALQREIDLRIRVYGRYAAEGKMTKTKADREIEIMRAILADYLKQKEPGP